MASDLYPLDYDALQRAIAPLAVTAAELHGSLCGYACAGGQPGAGQWLGQLCIDDDGLAASAEPSLESLRSATLALLDDPQMRFAPLLPDDDDALPLRVQAMGEWCAGFLGGFGLTGASDRETLSEQARDAQRKIQADLGASLEAGKARTDAAAGQ